MAGSCLEGGRAEEGREGAYRAAWGMGERQAHLAWAYLAVGNLRMAVAWGSLEEAYCRKVSKTISVQNEDGLTLEEATSRAAAGMEAFLGNLVAVAPREQMAAHLAAYTRAEMQMAGA